MAQTDGTGKARSETDTRTEDGGEPLRRRFRWERQFAGSQRCSQGAAAAATTSQPGKPGVASSLPLQHARPAYRCQAKWFQQRLLHGEHCSGHCSVGRRTALEQVEVEVPVVVLVHTVIRVWARSFGHGDWAMVNKLFSDDLFNFDKSFGHVRSCATNTLSAAPAPATATGVIQPYPRNF